MQSPQIKKEFENIKNFALLRKNELKKRKLYKSVVIRPEQAFKKLQSGDFGTGLRSPKQPRSD